MLRRVKVYVDGGMIGFRPLTPAAKTWVDEHVASEAWQWLGETLWIDARMSPTFSLAMMDAGFIFEHDTKG